jgi:hypothetical protein
MKQRHNLARFRIKTRPIRPLMQIAVITRQGKVGGLATSAMLFRVVF